MMLINSNYTNNNYCPVKRSNKLSFEGKSTVLKQIKKTTYLEPQKVQTLAEVFIDKIVNLYLEKNLNTTSVQAVIKELVPEHKIKIKSETAKSLSKKHDCGGFMSQKSLFGYKSTKLVVPFDLLESPYIEERRKTVEILGHEFTHALRYNTKPANNFYKSHFSYKDGLIYQNVQEALNNPDNIKLWKLASMRKEKGGVTSLMDNLVEKLLNSYKITKSKNKLQSLQSMYKDAAYESEAYKNGERIFFDSSNKFLEKFLNYHFYDDFAEAAQRRYLKEGGDPSKLVL